MRNQYNKETICLVYSDVAEIKQLDLFSQQTTLSYTTELTSELIICSMSSVQILSTLKRNHFKN